MAEARAKIDALDEAYRKLKGKGGLFRSVWQQARAKVMETGSWDFLDDNAVVDELLATAKECEAAASARAEASESDD